jgi:hypothetical protein
MILVLHTSNGVVIPAATAPATLPHIAASVARRSLTRPDDVRLAASRSLSRSYKGNWRHVKGIYFISSVTVHDCGAVVTHLSSDRTPKSSVEAPQPPCCPDALSYFPAPDSSARLRPLLDDLCWHSDHACSLHISWSAGITCSPERRRGAHNFTSAC